MGADGRRLPGAVSRWNAGKDLSFVLLRPDLVVEAAYEHLQGNRLRHTARFRRWRPDRDPRSCTYEQLDVAVPSLLSEVFGARG
jgi:ATP-dependent DNA ligase